MHITIYFKDKPLFLTDFITDDLQPYTTHDDTVVIDEFSSPAINSIIHEMKQEKIHAGILVYEDLEQLKEKVFRKFTMVTAAGGLVQDELGRVLMIFRRGHWDLPKGKLDDGETIEACAKREVEEETGLSSVEVLEPLVITYHTYEESGHHILKDSHWYHMRASSNGKLVPQEEEQITDIRWVPKNEIASYAEKSFGAIRDVLKAAGL